MLFASAHDCLYRGVVAAKLAFLGWIGRLELRRDRDRGFRALLLPDTRLFHLLLQQG